VGSNSLILYERCDNDEYNMRSNLAEMLSLVVTKDHTSQPPNSEADYVEAAARVRIAIMGDRWVEDKQTNIDRLRLT
jgi:hypothetical protein